MKFTFDKFRTEKIAVWCKSRLEAEEFLKLCNENGFQWKSGASFDAVTHWGAHGYATVYIAGYARPEIEYRNIEWAVRHGYTLVEANQIIRENKRCVRDDSVMAFGIAASVFAEMHNGDKDAAARPATDKPAGSIKETPAARWRDAESDKPKRDGDYIVSVVAVEDCEFSPRAYRVHYDITNGWDYIEGEVITHWLDNVPPFPEVVVR